MKVPNQKAMAKLSNTESVFMKTPEGEYLIRVMSDLYAVKEHSIKVDGKSRMIACPTEQARAMKEFGILPEDADIPPCPLCELGYPVSTKYLAVVVEREREEFDKKGNKIKVGGDAWVLKKGTTVFSHIQALHEDPDFGKGQDYDIKIVVTGKGLQTKYTITPVSKEKSAPLTVEEQRALASLAEKVDLEEMTTPRKYPEIKEIIGQDYPVYSKSDDGFGPF